MTNPMPLSDPAQVVRASVGEVQDNAHNLNLQWILRPATVVNLVDGEVYKCTYDGDTVTTPMISLVGVLAPNTRVMVMFVPPSGNYIIAVAGGLYPKLLKRGYRTTQSTAASGAQGVLRVDDIPLKANHFITAHTSSLILFSTVALDNPSARLSYTTDGTAATTGSTLMGIWNSPDIISVGDGAGGIVTGFFPVQTTDNIGSVLLYSIRVAGTGNVSMFATANLPTELRIIDWGPDPTNTGTVI